MEMVIADRELDAAIEVEDEGRAAAERRAEFIADRGALVIDRSRIYRPSTTPHVTMPTPPHVAMPAPPHVAPGFFKRISNFFLPDHASTSRARLKSTPYLRPKCPELPTLPSALLTLALADLDHIERDPRYRVNMMAWHVPRHNVTEVCLAGCVVAHTLQHGRSRGFDLSDFPPQTNSRLMALNEMRAGRVDLALRYVGIEMPVKIPDVEITDYRHDPRMFKADLFAMARMLEVHGL